MTYTIIRTVDIDCGDHGFSYQGPIKSGIKTIEKAEHYLEKICGSKKYIKNLKKEFEERHAIKLEEFVTVVDENDEQVSKYCWQRKVWKSEKSLFDI